MELDGMEILGTQFFFVFRMKPSLARIISRPHVLGNLQRLCYRIDAKSCFSTSLSTSSRDLKEFVSRISRGREIVPGVDEIHELIAKVRSENPESAPELLLGVYSSMQEDPSMDDFVLYVIDNVNKINSPNILLRLAEFSINRMLPPDYGLLHAVIIRSSDLLTKFNPSEFIGLISLCSRLDFVESNFAESVQQYIPEVSEQFTDNQLPILFSSILRLGIDQPVDRSVTPPVDDPTPPPTPSSLEFMTLLIDVIISRIPSITEAGCLTMLHSILRRSRSRMTREILTLVEAISDFAGIDEWPLHLRIQAIHSLSRFGHIDNQKSVESLFKSITRENIRKIPSANLQHLLSIIHNHSEHHSVDLWSPVLDICLGRISEPVIAKSMPMSTIAVTMGYMGRLAAQNNPPSLTNGIANLLNVFFTGTARLPRDLLPAIPDRLSDQVVNRILSDPQIDIAHLTGMIEAIDRLGAWDMYYALPLLMLTRRVAIRDGIHNIRAAPLCQLVTVFLNHSREKFNMTDRDVVAIDAVVDKHIACVQLGNQWSLINEGQHGSSDWCRASFEIFLEGIAKHEQYIRTTQSVLDRCLTIRSLLEGGGDYGVTENVSNFFTNLPQVAGDNTASE